ncbi:MAG: pilus assembly protein TadG-related protein, partial [Acidimicrobiales bacterium]
MSGRQEQPNDKGAVLVLMAFLLVTLLVMTAFAIDLGNARQFRRQAQATADTASLAAVAELTGQTDPIASQRAVDQVKLYAQRNFSVPVVGW